MSANDVSSREEIEEATRQSRVYSSRVEVTSRDPSLFAFGCLHFYFFFFFFVSFCFFFCFVLFIPSLAGHSFLKHFRRRRISHSTVLFAMLSKYFYVLLCKVCVRRMIVEQTDWRGTISCELSWCGRKRWLTASVLFAGSFNWLGMASVDEEASFQAILSFNRKKSVGKQWYCEAWTPLTLCCGEMADSNVKSILGDYRGFAPQPCWMAGTIDSFSHGNKCSF